MAPRQRLRNLFDIDLDHSAAKFFIICRVMAREHRPGEPAPETGHYAEHNVFGTPTGAVKHVVEGDRLPGAPRGFTWRLVETERPGDC